MPMYYFHLRDHKTLFDVDGTEFVDAAEARSHAIGVARELIFNRNGMLGRDWSRWRMSVNDDDGKRAVFLQDGRFRKPIVQLIGNP
jgi:hypothetical protein